MLAGKYEVTINGEKQKLDGAELVRFITRDVLMRRDSASVALLKEIRECTEGSKVHLLGEGMPTIGVLLDLPEDEGSNDDNKE